MMMTELVLAVSTQLVAGHGQTTMAWSSRGAARNGRWRGASSGDAARGDSHWWGAPASGAFYPSYRR